MRANTLSNLRTDLVDRSHRMAQQQRICPLLRSEHNLKTDLTLLASAALLFTASPAISMEISRAPPTVKAALQARDDAMAYKCSGGMFDCTYPTHVPFCLPASHISPLFVHPPFFLVGDGDRRDFAKKQYQNFVARMEGQTDEQQKLEPNDQAQSNEPQSNKNAPS